jgi:hypothetical protein
MMTTADSSTPALKQAPVEIERAELSVYAYRVIGHLRSVAREKGEIISQGVRPIAKECHISLGKVVSAKRELEEKGLIRIIQPGNPKTSTPDTIKLLI